VFPLFFPLSPSPPTSRKVCNGKVIIKEKQELCSEMSMGWREEKQSHVIVSDMKRNLRTELYLERRHFFSLYVVFLSPWSLLAAQKPQNKLRKVLSRVSEVKRDKK